MKYGLFYFELADVMKQTGKTLPETCSMLRYQDYRYVEADLDELDLDNISIIRDQYMFFSSVYCFLDFRRDMSKKMDKLMKFAELTAAKFVMPIPVSDGDPALKERTIAELNRLSSALAAENVQMVMENFDGPDKSFASVAGLRSYLDAIPGCGCCFDTGNFLYSGEELTDAYRQLKKRIVHVHVKDRRTDEKYGPLSRSMADGSRVSNAPAGAGMLPLEELMKQMVSDGYQGILIAEHAGCPDQAAMLTESIRTLKAWCSGKN